MNAVIRSADADDHRRVCDLLTSARLPLDGLPGDMAHFLVAEDAGRIVAAAGLEVYGGAALLRSVVVAPSHRGTGMGGQLSDRALALAGDLGIHDIYLLTDSAEAFFHRRGFAVVSRADVPRSVQASVEFATACPASATVMHRGVPPR